MAFLLILICCLQFSTQLVSAISSQCHCIDCNEFPNNPCPVKQSGSRCKPNWFGTYCQKENIAFNKPTSQSSTYMDEGGYPAGNAVDGNTDKVVTHKSCSHTNDTDESGAWWKVILSPSKEYNISHITVYFRDELELLSRNDGFQLKVNNQVCYSQQIIFDDELQITCDSMPGNEVSVHIPGIYLTLCEVQIFICSDGWFGDDCDKQCQCRNTSEVCAKGTGYCRSGCRAGRKGNGCQQECADYTYGDHCSGVCSCLNQCEVCHKVTGSCHTGYQPTTSSELSNDQSSTAAITTSTNDALTIGLSLMGSLFAATCMILAVMVFQYIKLRRRFTKYKAEKEIQYSSLTPRNNAAYDVITDSHLYANASNNENRM